MVIFLTLRDSSDTNYSKSFSESEAEVGENKRSPDKYHHRFKWAWQGWTPYKASEEIIVEKSSMPLEGQRKQL